MLFQSVTLSVLLASASALGPASVDLGTAENYAILTKSGISSTGVTSVVGDLGVSPINEAAITGFDLIHDETTHSTSALVTGNVFAADRASPTPSVLTTAVSDMQRPRSVMLSSFEGRRNVTFDGQDTADAVWILQIAQDVLVGSNAAVVLAGGAKAESIFWQVAGHVDVGTSAHLEGIFLVKTHMAFKTGSSLNGKAFSQTAVTYQRGGRR